MKVILPVLPDIASGIFAVIISSWWFEADMHWWYFLVGISVAVLPDIDAIPELLKKGQVGKRQSDGLFATDHRSYLHFPLFYVMASVVIIVLDPFWGLVFSVATFLHFGRDLVGTGWGVKVFWPISNKSYKFLTASTNNYEHPKESMVAWTDQEVGELIEVHGNENWIEDTYLKLTKISIVEYSWVLFVVVLTICMSLVTG